MNKYNDLLKKFKSLRRKTKAIDYTSEQNLKNEQKVLKKELPASNLLSRVDFWQPEEVDYLKLNYTLKGDYELARILTSKSSINKTWRAAAIKKKRLSLILLRSSEQEKAIRLRNKSLVLLNENYQNAKITLRNTLQYRRSENQKRLIELSEAISTIRYELLQIQIFLIEESRFNYPGRIKTIDITEMEQKKALLEREHQLLIKEYSQLPQRLRLKNKNIKLNGSFLVILLIIQRKLTA